MINEKHLYIQNGEIRDNDIDFERLTDIEVANKLREHIENPCGADINNEVMEGVRENYIKMAQAAIKNFTNPFAKDLLDLVIKKYKKV